MWIEERSSRQLPLPFGSAGTPDSLPSFLPSPTNEEARRMVQAWQADALAGDGKAGSPGILISGPEGTGKSLLLAYLGRDAGVGVHDACDLSGRHEPWPHDRVILIDDVHQCPASDLVRLINLCLERNVPHVLAGRGDPRDWAGEGDDRLEDLASRLSASPAARLQKPDETLLAAAIRHRLAARQVRIEKEIAAFAASKLRRSLHSATRFAEALDSEALARQKTIDRTLAQQVLALIPEAVL